MEYGLLCIAVKKNFMISIVLFVTHSGVISPFRLGKIEKNKLVGEIEQKIIFDY